MFWGKVSSRRLLMRQGDRDLETEIVQEIDAQITLLETSGFLFPTSMASTRHVFPLF